MSEQAEILHKACWDCCSLIPIIILDFGSFLKITSSYDVILTYFCQCDIISDGILLKGLEQRNNMVLVSCLYLHQNKSYSKKCVFDLFGDLDLVLDPILIKNIRVLSITFVNMYVKYLVDPMETVASRALTDKQMKSLTE